MEVSRTVGYIFIAIPVVVNCAVMLFFHRSRSVAVPIAQTVAVTARTPSGPSSPLRVGWTTCSSKDAAEKLARTLIDSRLAACAQVSGPVTSFYSWRGEVQNDVEWRVTVKYPAGSDEEERKLAAFIKKHHEYDLPQWVSVAATGSDEYVSWVSDMAPRPAPAL
eukprot:TRINITY_DN58474_c0_g1_i1.p1 TRINITY_DN58474_c0_g1~~TRINITY_DN58474_c0_g1_i1.p1  ORF type:complete len:164 (+),score=12.70 TRINITY_DN58474_c0_g1_i1:80-571(+)